MQISQQCAHCMTETRCSRRDFSEQAWSVLLAWKEVGRTAVDQPLCNDCYDELREILIDRAEELTLAINDPVAFNSSVAENAKKRASAAEPKKKLAIGAAKKAAPAAKKAKKTKRVA